MLSIVYDGLYNNLHSFIKKKHYIPYKILSTDTKFKEGNRYYIAYYRQTMKVISIEYDKYGILEYCYVKWDDGNYGAYCTNLAIFDDYLMDIDSDFLYKEEDIVNSPNIHTGAEIKYWLFVNNITAASHKYGKIWESMNEILQVPENEYNKYKITGVLDEDGSYTSIKMSKINVSKIIPA